MELMEKNKCLVCGRKSTNFVGDTMENLCNMHFKQRYEVCVPQPEKWVTPEWVKESNLIKLLTSK
jgi:hypothetical protein